MTGFARADGAHGALRFHWELRSVNGRGLDVRLRLPPGLDALEPALREEVTRALARGNVAATLTLERGAETGEVRINEQALATVLAAVERLAARPGFAEPSPEGVLALRGVIEAGEADGIASDEAKAALLATFRQALVALGTARRAEGERLAGALSGALAEIESLVAQIAALPARQPAAIQARLAETVTRLAGLAAPLDPDRLHQEAALAATRADVEEELKRLGAHIAAGRALLSEAAPVGRRLDFLAQELNREANTICSKSIDVEMTRLGLALKAVIDQLREQVQNIE